MNWINMSRATLTGLCLAVGAHAHAVGTLHVGFGGTLDGVSVRSATTLTETGTFGVPPTLEGIEAGAADQTTGVIPNLYVAAGDSIINYTTAGAVIATSTVAGAAYSDVALLGAQVFVTASGATPGVSARDLNTLVEADFFATAFTPTSIEDGFGRLYVTAGDTLFILNSTGMELANTSSGGAGVTFVESAILGTRLYAATGGATNSVLVLNPITLAPITSFALPFAVEGMVAGDADDLYITSGANIFRYSTAGVELDSVADTTAGRAFSDIAFLANPLPPAAGTVLAINNEAGGASVASRDAATLADAGSFDVIAAGATGIALGAANDVYLSSGDSLFRYGTGGALLASVTVPGAGYEDVALVGGELIVATGTGLSVRDLASLVETSSVPLGFSPTSVAAGPVGEIFLTAANQVLRFTADGATELAAFSGPAGVTYTDVALVQNVVYATFTSTAQNAISVLDPSSLGQSDVILTGAVAATGIAAGGANDYYISGGDTIVHYALDQVLASFPVSGADFPDVVFSTQGSSAQTAVVASTLPAVRSVQVGNTASAFATIINTGPVTASGCQIQPATTVMADFSYQTTDPGTNELVGTVNTPADIASNGSQSFFFSFVPTAAFNATEIELDFECVNAPAAPVFSGLNTLLLVADAAPVPDMIALALTPNGLGIIDVPGVGGTGFFSVASVNVGVAGDIAVSAEVTDGDPSVTLFICETNPVTGACINPTVPTTGVVDVTIPANGTPTFSVFAAASAAIALDPALKRIQVNFADQAGGTVRGATSVAIRTQ